METKSAARHCCAGTLPHDGYGTAIDGCEEDLKGRFWVGNGEYGSQVFFCPYCGAKAPSPPVLKDDDREAASA